MENSKTYTIENTYIGFLNDGQEYHSYIEAMIDLMAFVQEDEKSSNPYRVEYPKSKWAICQSKGEGAWKTVYSLPVKKAIK